MAEPRFVIVVSDIHAGCKLGLCPPEGVILDDGGEYRLSRLQLKLWEAWRYFWDEWVPWATKGEPFVLVVNGDALEGVHHRATTQISHNIGDQTEIAYQLLAPVVDRAQQYFHVRGTDAHVGPSGTDEDRLAKRLGAVPNQDRQHARHELWLNLGGKRLNFMHHIGTTGSAAYESTALNAELVDAYCEAARWGFDAPDAIIRSHRHRNCEVRVPACKGVNISMTTAAWQLKTPYCYTKRGIRMSPPQYGGSMLYLDEYGELDAKHCVWTATHSEIENGRNTARRSVARTGQSAQRSAEV